MDEELQLSDIPINDRIVMDTGCNLSFLLRFIHEGYVKDLKYDGTIDIQTINDFSTQPVREGELAGMRAVINGNSNYSLFGVGPLMRALHPHGSYLGDHDGLDLLFKGNVFYRAVNDTDGIPWGSLKVLISKLEDKKIQSIIKTNNIKCFILLRSQTNKLGNSNDVLGVETPASNVSSVDNSIRRSARPRVSNPKYKDHVTPATSKKGVKPQKSKKSKNIVSTTNPIKAVTEEVVTTKSPLNSESTPMEPIVSISAVDDLGGVAFPLDTQHDVDINFDSFNHDFDDNNNSIEIFTDLEPTIPAALEHNAVHVTASVVTMNQQEHN